MRMLVIGCGRVGAGLARTLALAAHDVTVVDSDRASFERLGEGFGGRTLRGFGTDRRVLREAGIERVDGLAAVTGSDEVNAVVARVASRVFGVPRVVARLYDPGQADLYRRLGIMTISQVAWGIRRLADLLTRAEFAPVAAIGTGDLQIVDAEVPPLLAGRRVDELTVPGEIRVIALTRGGRTFLATSESRLEAGDTAHVVLHTASASRLEELLGRG